MWEKERKHRERERETEAKRQCPKWERWMMEPKWNVIPSNGKKSLPESRSLKLQKIYLSGVAWSTVRLTKLLTLTLQNQNEWREDRRGGEGNQNALLSAGDLRSLAAVRGMASAPANGTRATKRKSTRANRHLCKYAPSLSCISYVICLYMWLCSIKAWAKLSLAAVHCFLELGFVVPFNDYFNSLLTAIVTSAMSKKYSLQTSITEHALPLKYTQCPWQESIGGG